MIRSVLEQHAMEAAFLWSLRSAAAGDPHYDLNDLDRLDERLEAQLDGLRLGGDAAWEICEAELEEGAGEVFAATAVAVDRGDLPGIAHVLDVAAGDRRLRRAMISALGWIAPESTSRILPGLLDPSCPAPLQLLGIAACAVHRIDPGAALGYALYSSDAALSARALRAVGQLGRADLMAELRAALDAPKTASEGAPDDERRFSAAWSLALLGDTAASLPTLWELAARGGPFAQRSCALAARRGDPVATAGFLRPLGQRPETLRLAVIGAGALGDPYFVPWLLQVMADPALARLAGESFSMITGADLGTPKLRGAAPEGFKAGPTEDPADGDVAVDPDENLPWPAMATVTAWWAANRSRLPERARHLLGKPVDRAWAAHVLRHGYQRQRAAAALETTLAAPGQPLFEVRAPAFRQRRALAGGASP